MVCSHVASILGLSVLFVLAPACQFSLQSGDVTNNSAIIQASLASSDCRTSSSERTVAQVLVATDPQLTAVIANHSLQAVSYAGIDPRENPGAYVAKLFLSDLDANTKYYYQFTSETAVKSPLGSFVTLRDYQDERQFSFVHMSCANRNPYPVSAALNRYVTHNSPDFAIFNGDAVYADRFWLSENATFDQVNRCCRIPNTTADYYNSLYVDQRSSAYTGEGFPEVLRSIPIFSVWDDHEVNDNFVGQDGNPRRIQDTILSADVQLPDTTSKHKIEAQYLFGRKAFFEMNGVTPGNKLQSDDPAPGLRSPETRFFRRIRVGKHVEVFMLDLRQYRDTQVPAIGLLPVRPPNVTDEELCGAVPEVAALGLSGCDLFSQPIANQTGFRDADKTLMGKEQKQWLKMGLNNSDSTFKIIITSVQIMEWYLAPGDRWEGYWKERKELLSFIEEENIKNVVFLAGDIHASIFSRINPGRSPAIHEFSTGPIGSSTFGAFLSVYQGEALRYLNSYGSNAHLTGEKAVMFSNIAVPNFMSVYYSDRSLTVRCIGPDGEIVTDPLGNYGEFVVHAEQ